jgi:hypothetical protein
MNNYFTYILLQYKHSLSLGEVLNVGILFYFEDENRFEFVTGTGTRAKSIYPDFDVALFNAYQKAISEKVKKQVDLFYNEENRKDIAAYIHSHILARDAAGLVFGEPKQIKNVWNNSRIAVEEYSKLLLPGIITSKPTVIRHNESFILKKYTHYIFDKHRELEEKIAKNEVVKTKHLTLKFDLSWRNKTRNLVKPISFDLTDTQSIQSKAATYLGYLTQLEDYSKINKTRFDFLIAKPQDNSLKRDYENAIDILDWFKGTPKILVTEDKWEKYTEDTIDALLNH